MQLTSGTDYDEVLADLGGSGGVKPGVLSERFRDKFVQDFRYLRCNATGSLATFLDYIMYQDMTGNM